jgi:hypothetical protein
VHGATPSPHPAAAAAARARAARLRSLRRVTCLVTGGFKAAEPLIVNQDSLLVVHITIPFAVQAAPQYLWDFAIRKNCKPIQYNFCPEFNKKRGRVLRDGSVRKARSCLAFPLWRVQFALQPDNPGMRKMMVRPIFGFCSVNNVAHLTHSGTE